MSGCFNVACNIKSMLICVSCIIPILKRKRRERGKKSKILAHKFKFACDIKIKIFIKFLTLRF